MNQTRRSGYGKSGLATALALLAGALAVYKRIPLTNRIGDNGNAYFGMACDIFLFFFLLCGYASQTVVAQMAAARCARGQYRNTRRVWNTAIFYAAVSGVAGSVLLLSLADILAAGLLRTQEAAFVVRCMAPFVLAASLTGAFRGYFQGMGSMVPTAFSRLAEELSGILFMFLLVPGMAEYGKKVGALLFQPDYEQAFGAGGAALAFGLGSLICLLLLAVLYVLFQGSFRRRERKDTGKAMEDYGSIGRRIAGMALPVVVTGFVMEGSFILDQVFFMRLMPSGTEAAVQWGIYTGKYRILASVPAMLAAAACTGLIPSLSVSFSGMNAGRMREKAFLMLKLSAALSLPFAVWFAVMADSLIPALFTVGDMETAARLLRTGSVSMVLQALAVGTACILKGFRQDGLLLAASAVSLILHVILLSIFLGSLGMGTDGVIWAVTGLYGVFAAIGIFFALRAGSLRGDWGRLIGIPAISCAVMGLVVFLMNRFLSALLDGKVLCLLCFAAGTVVYVLLMLSLRDLSQRELKSVPGGGALLALGRFFRFY